MPPTIPPPITVTPTWRPLEASMLIEVGHEEGAELLALWRAIDGMPEQIIRGSEGLLLTAGVLILDHEAPLDTIITYRAQTTLGDFLSHPVASPKAANTWGVWLKAPGDPTLTVHAPLVSVDGISSEMIGEAYQVPGRAAIISSHAITPERTVLTVRATDDAAWWAMKNLYAASRVWLIQYGDASPFGDGWWAVTGKSATRIGQQPDTPQRNVALTILRAERPAGIGTGLIPGTSWAGVVAAKTNWQHVVNTVASWSVLRRGDL